MRAAARCAAFVLLLGAALATVPGKPTVWDIRGGWHRRSAVSVSVASASQGKDSYNYDKYDNYGYEEKEVCLQEVERKSCHTHLVEGCDDSGSGGGCGGSCDCDRVHSFWTSDLACCHDKHDYGYSRGSTGVNDHLWGSGGHGGAIGSCDWTWHYVDDDWSSITITNNIYKLGSADGVCYFGADSQECGGPFCERMVMSLEGNVYRVERVYSYWTQSDTTSTSTNPYYRDSTCDLGQVYINTGGTGRQAGDGAKQVTPAPATTPAPAASNRGSAPAAAVKPMAVPPMAQASNAHADTQYYHSDEGHYENRAVYYGRAVVINGIVSSMAGPRKDKWDSGVFEYVMGFQNNGIWSSGVDNSTPWIRDKAYKFTFYKQATYGY